MDNVYTLTICCYCVVNSWYTGYIQDRRPGRMITKKVKLIEFILHSKEVGYDIYYFLLLWFEIGDNHGSTCSSFYPLPSSCKLKAMASRDLDYMAT